MDKAKYIFKLLASLVILLAAIVQWVVLLERGWAAGWSWYKFHGYGEGGYITVGRKSQTIFYILSCTLALVGLLLPRLFNQSEKMASFLIRVSRFGAVLLIVGVICWTALLLSPLVVFR